MIKFKVKNKMTGEVFDLDDWMFEGKEISVSMYGGIYTVDEVEKLDEDLNAWLEDECVLHDYFEAVFATGIKDKNGVEICEGDKLESYYDKVNGYVVEDILHFGYIVHDLALEGNELEIVNRN